MTLVEARSGPTPDAGVAFLDLHDPTLRGNSGQVRAAQAGSWYARSALGIVVLRYPEAQALLADRRLLHGTTGWLARQGVGEGPLSDWWRMIMPNVEGASPARLRGLVSKAFIARSVQALRPVVRTLGGGLHYCRGAALARTGMREAFTVLAARLGGPRPAGPVWWRPFLGVFGPVALPIHFTSR